MREMRSCSGIVVSWLLVVLAFFSWQIAVVAQPQQTPKTDPIEVAALNAIMGRWGLKASPEWNISGEPCSGFAIDGTDWDNQPNINPFIKCICSFVNNTVCHITRLRVVKLDVVGQIPSELQNLTYLEDLIASDNEFTGKLPDNLGGLTNLQDLAFQGNSFEGPIPASLSNLTKLTKLRIGDIVNRSTSMAFISNLTSLNILILRNCMISGDLEPVDFSRFAALMFLDMSFNNITGQIPQSILNNGNLQFLFLGNNSLTGRLPDVISTSLKVIDFSYNQLTGSYPSWASQNNLQLNLVGNNFVLSSTNNRYLWHLNCLQQDAPCFRGSPEYYSFAVDCELVYPDSQTWVSLGRRVFDIYVQGALKEKNFDIRKTAGYNGPMISALSVTPNFTPTYLENGSLDQALFGDRSLNLDWTMRFEIILGIARGLTYLHEESSVRIVHRDIKASNILLDIDLTPKISDFGLAKLYDEKQTHVSTKIAGTLGYLAPEYAMKGRLTEKADVFAFGVVVLETVAGRSNTDNSLEESMIYLFEWAWDLREKGQVLGIVDPSLMEFNKDEALRVILVALQCTQGSPHQRPSMSKVVGMLTGEVEVAEVVTKPSYVTQWQLRDVNRSYGVTAGSYSESTTSDYSKQKEIQPLTLSPMMTGSSHEGR
ncbi:hypothetical protein GUJ93_ZPchr0005g15990 [Zizania palustris]|uniref:non-specific serine/threonine protein kinase n=1 Tax=Zizania palustris TaxID=103762 RepID=A0A8J5W0E7_ZIZPA|nr:hypothetical protein GUJ93_ZPchr0005g15990 [Zizania palustris]